MPTEGTEPRLPPCATTKKNNLSPIWIYLVARPSCGTMGLRSRAELPSIVDRSHQIPRRVFDSLLPRSSSANGASSEPSKCGLHQGRQDGGIRGEYRRVWLFV